ncbi:hypothetical protein PVAP13_9NG006000 [Panicum virgatum]|uniref:Uncharacterized protein n=1 Tax=Panicum virgatum TaxID=38727 RepID=A0A8T0MFE1_PANVG|nr:hypothetical protein PVAP13_9NG006000 [Panicum virgatum]
MACSRRPVHAWPPNFVQTESICRTARRLAMACSSTTHAHAHSTSDKLALRNGHGDQGQQQAPPPPRSRACHHHHGGRCGGSRSPTIIAAVPDGVRVRRLVHGHGQHALDDGALLVPLRVQPALRRHLLPPLHQPLLRRPPRRRLPGGGAQAPLLPPARPTSLPPTPRRRTKQKLASTSRWPAPRPSSTTSSPGTTSASISRRSPS